MQNLALKDQKVDSLANKSIEVNRATQELHMTLLQEGFIPVNKMKVKYQPELLAQKDTFPSVPVGWRAGDVRAQPLALLPEPLVQ